MALENILDQPLNPWMAGGGPDGDIVLSSRIRLARNFEAVPFPNRAKGGQLAAIVDQLRKSVNDLTNLDGHRYLFIEMEKLSPLERYVLVEKHIISPNLAQEAENRALIVRDDAAVSIMINEEDHLRIQCLAPGLNLNDALKWANKVDDAIEGRHDIAFSEQMGYLTACPTNLGTGLRASVMVHLPALVLSGQINRLVTAATQLGLAVRGIYGEGSEAVGNIFQISNQLTLGHGEQEIVENLYSVARQVVDHERSARQALLAESRDVLADRVWRAYGVLRYARSLSGQEALSMLSEVRLGIDLKIIDEVPPVIFNELLVTTRPNFLQKLAGRAELGPAERDRLRAQIIRQRLEDNKTRGGK
ncbi:protein arginine kinase [Sporolituus thermophilus]|uniref:Protein-arginine kinase n=1 Tax=Sporolituus thermophilus DSM 23256 TaxID=1123285 RepID=A0A1G7PE50_9FIRM|nr:protein arginine kinase [Sporolituus thermophilus]SDF84511.1 protein arginine kinase [Sporolituus thermophilus DSM 23256]